MLDIITRYNALCADEKAYRDNLDEKIEKKSRQVERLEKRRHKAPNTGWIEGVVVPIAKQLEEITGLTHEIYGPFGMDAETSIYLRKDMTKSITEQETRSITLRPRWNSQDKFYIAYETGESTGEYQPGSLGALNRLDKITKPFPNTIEEIEALLMTSGTSKEETE